MDLACALRPFCAARHQAIRAAPDVNPVRKTAEVSHFVLMIAI